MPKKKTATPKDEKLEKIDFNLFEALAAIDKKDYRYYQNLTPEQKSKFSAYMMLHWTSTVKSNANTSLYYLLSTEAYANKHIFNEHVANHPELQWLMFCAASPGIGKQFHKWIPHIKEKVSKLKEPAKLTDIKEYFKKVYSKASPEDIDIIGKAFVESHKRKLYLAKKFPNMKIEDIETLNELITDDDIDQYEKEYGN